MLFQRSYERETYFMYSHHRTAGAERDFCWPQPRPSVPSPGQPALSNVEKIAMDFVRVSDEMDFYIVKLYVC